MKELARIIVIPAGTQFQATGRGRNDEYLGTEFSSVVSKAVNKVMARARKGGVLVNKDRVEIVTELPKPPVKVGPDRY